MIPNFDLHINFVIRCCVEMWLCIVNVVGYPRCKNSSGNCDTNYRWWSGFLHSVNHFGYATVLVVLIVISVIKSSKYVMNTVLKDMAANKSGLLLYLQDLKFNRY